jgi:hypothetical protein
MTQLNVLQIDMKRKKKKENHHAANMLLIQCGVLWFGKFNTIYYFCCRLKKKCVLFPHWNKQPTVAHNFLLTLSLS